jgi:hypothetical protein
LESGVRDLFRKGPKNQSSALDSTGLAATDKKLNNTQHEDLNRRPDGKAKDEDVGYMA